MELQKLFVTLTLDAKNYANGLRSAVSEAQSAGGRIARALGDGLKRAGAMAVGAIAAIGTTAVATAVLSGKAFIDFQTQMNEVFTLLPDASDEMKTAMVSDVKELSKEFGVLPNEVVPALYQAISAGVSQDNVFDFLEIATKASIGGVTELETAVDGITSVVNAYGSEVMEAGRASDIMFTAVRLGKTDFGQLSSSLFNVIPTAASLGISFEEVAAGLATLTAQGTPTSVATTQLRSLFVELSKTGGDLATVIEKELGASFGELVGDGMSVASILQKVRDSMPEDEFRNMFGSVEALNAALGTTGPNFEGMMDNMDDMFDSVGATDGAFRTMSDGMQFTIDRMKAFGATALLDIGEALSPVIGIVLDFAERALPKIADVINNHVVPVIDTVADVFERFFFRLELGLSPTRALVGALKQAGFKDIGDNVQWLSDKFFEMKEVVMEFIQPIIDFVAEHVKLQDVMIALGIAIAVFVLPILGSMLLAIAGIMLPILAVIAVVALLRKAWENDWGGIQGKTAEAIKFVKGFISDGLAAISAWWAEHGATVIAIVTTLFQGIVTAVTTYLGIVYTVVSTILGNIAMFWAEHGESIKETASKAWEAIQKSVEVVTRLILGVIATFLALVTGDLEGAKKIWNDVVVETWEEIKQIFTDGIEGARKIIAETDWTTLGKNLVQGFINGIMSMIGAVVDAAKDLAQSALDAIKGVLDTGSPSRETHALAQMAALGMQNGLIEGIPAVAAAAGNMAQAVISAISDLDLAGKMSSVMGSFTSLFNAKEVKPLEDALKGVSKTVVDLAKETGYTADELRLMTSQDLNMLGMFGTRGINQGLIDALKQESDLLSELAEKQEKLAEIERQKQNLAMLQAQQSLLDLVKDNDLNADILSGLTFGLDADLGAILAATSAAMQQMLTEAASGFGGYALASAMPMSGNGGGGSNYTANTTVNVASGDDPLRALHASRLLDKIGP